VADVLNSLPVSRRLPAGHYGALASGVSASEIFRAAATLIAGRGQGGLVVETARSALSVELVDGPRCAFSEGAEFIGIGPGRWLVTSEGDGEALTQRLDAAFAPQASVVDQSGGLVVFEASGARLAETLPKFVAIDLDESIFPVGAAATTTAAHINLTLWRVGPEIWRFAVGRSYAAAFLRLLAVSAAEFGFELR
jgi:sarcosine oxidase subunit gamma